MCEVAGHSREACSSDAEHLHVHECMMYDISVCMRHMLIRIPWTARVSVSRLARARLENRKGGAPVTSTPNHIHAIAIGERAAQTASDKIEADAMPLDVCGHFMPLF